MSNHVETKAPKNLSVSHGRMDRWTDGRTDGETEYKPKIPFGKADSGLK